MSEDHEEVETPVVKVRKCTLCRRPLTECNAEPCEGKQRAKSQRARLAGGAHSSSRQQATQSNFLLGKANKRRGASPLAQWLGSITDASNDADSQNDNESAAAAQPPAEEIAAPVDELSANFNRLIINAQTGEPQFTLIAQLQENIGISGTSHWCCVTGYDRLGVSVDLIVDLEDNRWVLNEIYLMWRDIPQLADLTTEQRQAFGRIRWPFGSQFKGLITELHINTLRITVSKHPNPKIRAPPSVEPEDWALPFMKRCPYKYLIILDLESTCDYGPEPKVDTTNSEILEFPWVVLDTETLEVVDERQIYVLPDRLEGVTSYCTKLTGITKEMVSSGVPLAKAIQTFVDYVQEEFNDDRNLFKIVTDGRWDLAIQLHSEATRKHIPIPTVLKEYFDLKDEFLKCFTILPEDFRPSLKSLLGVLGLRIVGQHHRGLDDCKTITQVVKRLLAFGHGFDSPRVVPSGPDYDPYKDPFFVDFGSKTEPLSWKCATPDCGIWNRPWMHYCRFCDCGQTTLTITSLGLD